MSLILVNFKYTVSIHQLDFVQTNFFTLRFHGDRQWVQYGEGGPRVSFLANRTSEGTWPRGSQWTRNPIPACAGPWGGYNEAEAHCFQEGGATQFPPPAPGRFYLSSKYFKSKEKNFPRTFWIWQFPGGARLPDLPVQRDGRGGDPRGPRPRGLRALLQVGL